MQANQSTDYSAVVSAVRSAIQKDNESQNKWKVAGLKVRDFYGSESAIVEVKAQFLADAVIPELSKVQQTALARELPRKNSKEYAAWIDALGEKAWRDAKDEKANALGLAHSMFRRVVDYAFPKAPTPKADAPKADAPEKTLATKVADIIGDAIGKCEKAEGATFDIAATLGHLRAALAVVTSAK